MIEYEESNADFWLQPETKPKMIQILEDELINKMAEIIASKESGVIHMF